MGNVGRLSFCLGDLQKALCGHWRFSLWDLNESDPLVTDFAHSQGWVGGAAEQGSTISLPGGPRNSLPGVEKDRFLCEKAV